MDVGLFGGSFDPPHVGHLIVAQDALERLGLERVRFVPARVSPFKVGEAGSAPPELRLDMVRAAVAGHERFEVDGRELERAPPSYTVDTLRELARAEPEVRWTLLLGSDQWASFERWREPEVILELARVAVMSRSGDRVDALPRLGPAPGTVPVTRIDVSSSDVRDRIRRGCAIRYLVPEAVRAIIEANGLYATC